MIGALPRSPLRAVAAGKTIAALPGRPFRGRSSQNDCLYATVAARRGLPMMAPMPLAAADSSQDVCLFGTITAVCERGWTVTRMSLARARKSGSSVAMPYSERPSRTRPTTL